VKELDKIIKLFNETGDSLLIMWSGPDEKYLKSISKWNIIFIWRIEDPLEKIKIIKNALWLINITKESFGLVTVESLLLWVPVFAYNDWASPELINNNSWVLVPDKEHKTLVEYFQKFQKKQRNRKHIQSSIQSILK
jgi:glycosyltransferase involved in cell wall biosynthesis